MKMFIVCLISLFAQGAFAKSIYKDAVTRDEDYKVKIKPVVMKDLLSEDSYDGKYFKIVHGKSSDAISFKASQALQLKAATTYYHLTKARDYFINVAQSEYTKSLPKLTIRIDLTNVFNEVGHFANDNLNPQFNNALTIPAGRGFPSRGVSPWDIEIWFRPSKTIHVDDFDGVVQKESLRNSLQVFRNESHMSSLRQFFIELFGGAASENPESLVRLAGTSLLMEFLFQTSDYYGEFFSRKYYRLDSALVPEIIYHEYAHVALSKHFELSHSTPVNEGMADFFAGKIANSKKLALKIKDYNLFNGKKVRKKQQYNIAFERGDYANADFVFGLLWNVGEIVGTDIEVPFMNRLTSKLGTNDNIRDNLIDASIDTCRELCKNPISDKFKLFQFFHKKNL